MAFLDEVKKVTWQSPRMLLGILLFLLAAVGMTVAAFMPSLGGGVPAVASVVLLIAFALVEPRLMYGRGDAPSTMRVAVLMVVATFMLVVIKSGWENHAAPALDSTWAWVLGIALTGKVAQVVGERPSPATPAPPLVGNAAPAVGNTVVQATSGPKFQPQP